MRKTASKLGLPGRLLMIALATAVVLTIVVLLNPPMRLLDEGRLVFREPAGSSLGLIGMTADGRFLCLDSSSGALKASLVTSDFDTRAPLPKLSNAIALSRARKSDHWMPFRLSPDGRWLLFAWGPRRGLFEVVAAATDDSRQIRWTKQASLEQHDLQWSGDSRRIYGFPWKTGPSCRVYSLENPHETTEIKLASRPNHRNLLASIGTDHILLSEDYSRPRETLALGNLGKPVKFEVDWPRGGYQHDTAVSPDSSHVAFLVWVPLRYPSSGWMNNVLSYMSEGDRVHLLVSRPDGSETRNLGTIEGFTSNCYGPSDNADLLGWTPDSKRILLQFNDSVYGIPAI